MPVHERLGIGGDGLNIPGDNIRLGGDSVGTGELGLWGKERELPSDSALLIEALLVLPNVLPSVFIELTVDALDG